MYINIHKIVIPTNIQEILLWIGRNRFLEQVCGLAGSIVNTLACSLAGNSSPVH